MSAVGLAVAIGLAAGAVIALAGSRRRRGTPRERQATAAPPPAPPGPGSAAPADGAEHALHPSEPLRLLAHELRTPLAAIIGYHELLEDGLLGPIEGRAAEAVHRIGGAAEQMRHLLDGLHEMLIPPDADPGLEPEDVSLGPVIAATVESLRAMAEGRRATLQAELPADLGDLRTDRPRFTALLDLALGAAVRASPGRALDLRVRADGDGFAAEIRGSALEPGRDDVALQARARGPLDSGASLRLAMAARVARSLGGRISVERDGAGTTLHIEVAPLPN